MADLAELTERIQSLVSPYITPIVGDHKNGLLYSIGTATYLSYKKRRFLLTAAHVAAKLADGYALGVFAGQLNPPGIIPADWWTTKNASWGDEKWEEDIAILDVTKHKVRGKCPIKVNVLRPDIELGENQGIFLSGYAKNPTNSKDGKETNLLQNQDLEKKVLTVRALTTGAPPAPGKVVTRDFEFPLHFSSLGYKSLDGQDLDFIFDARGLSGSAVWRVKNSPPSPATVELPNVEIIGIATRWSEQHETILVTRCDEILEVLNACMTDLEV